MITIPRAELQEVGRRHNIDYDYGVDPSIEQVRELAELLREQVKRGLLSAHLSAEADDLDALADRHEREAS